MLKGVGFGSVNWHAEPIEQIIIACVRAGDAVMISDCDGRVIRPAADLITHGIFDALREQDVTVYGNDSYEANCWQRLARESKHRAVRVPPGERVREVMRDPDKANHLRVQSLLSGPFGLKKKKGRKFQVVVSERMLDLLRGSLECEGVDHAVALPAHSIDAASIEAFRRAARTLRGMDEAKKLEAIDVIASTPVGRALVELQFAAQWRGSSEEVRARAKAALEDRSR